MRYPTKLIAPTLYRQTQEVFAGYDRKTRTDAGAFRDMENMTSDHYPVLSSRPKRGLYAKGTSGGGLLAKDSLCYIDGTCLVKNGYRYDLGLTPGEKQTVSMGAYVIILPDKKYFNTADDTFGAIEAEFISRTDVEISLCMADGGAFDRITVSDREPEDPKEQDYWLDTSGKTHSLKVYSKAQESWVSVAATYVRISAPGIGAGFSQYDGVTVSGILGAELGGANSIWARGEDFIVITGLLEQRLIQYADEGSITVARKMPELDFITESENRLWGCRYGLNAQGQVVNELYASALGDFKNWNRFMGLSTDSYAVSCGTDGPFTGAATHLGYPLFFKENYIHKVYGSFPEDFRVQTTACRGVQKGSHRSLALVGELLFYKSQTGVCAYDGALPVEVSRDLGREAWHSAVAGAVGSKYYISMADSRDRWHLLVYDREKNLWHREDSLRAAAFCPCRGELYCIDAHTGDILALLGSGEPAERQVAWMAQTGEIGLELPEQKYVSRLLLRLELGEGARAQGFTRYDSREDWEPAFFLESRGLLSHRVDLRLKRCDHMQLRLQGVGDMKLYSITKIVGGGSDQP